MGDSTRSGRSPDGGLMGPNSFLRPPANGSRNSNDAETIKDGSNVKLMPVKADNKENAMRTNSHDADALKSSRTKLK